jgi:hypothetical protein
VFWFIFNSIRLLSNWLCRRGLSKFLCIYRVYQTCRFDESTLFIVFTKFRTVFASLIFVYCLVCFQRCQMLVDGTGDLTRKNIIELTIGCTFMLVILFISKSFLCLKLRKWFILFEWRLISCIPFWNRLWSRGMHFGDFLIKGLTWG